MTPLRDKILFIKHNLNAKAIAGLSSEMTNTQANVDTSVRDMDECHRQVDAFIQALQTD